MTLGVFGARLSAAQTPPEGRVEVGGGWRWMGPTHFSVVDANEIVFGGRSRALFRTSSELETSPALDARVSVKLMGGLRVESAIALNPTHLATHVTGDVEG